MSPKHRGMLIQSDLQLQTELKWHYLHLITAMLFVVLYIDRWSGWITKS